MKKLLTLACLFLLSGTALPAQTLSFSQVLLIDNNTATVPAGKVWKVESVLATSNLSSTFASYSPPTPSNPFFININGTAFSCSKLDISASYSSDIRIYYSIDRDMFPIWLPAGSTLSAGTGISRVNVIEFNVNP